MHTQHHLACRAVARTTYLSSFAIGALAVALGLANSASAGLIIDAVNYNGHVTNGTTFGVEAHSTTNNFPPPAPPIANIPLPFTGSPPPPLLAAKNLVMSFNDGVQEFGPGGCCTLFDTGIIEINSASGGRVFANNLDSTVIPPVYPVEADIFLYSDQPGKKIVIAGGNIGVESIGLLPPFVPPANFVITGGGTQANPLHVHMGLTINQVNTGSDYGRVKFHLRYTTMDAPIPEPASLALAALGCLGLIGTARRRLRAW